MVSDAEKCWGSFKQFTTNQNKIYPDSNVHGANMGPILGRQDPGGPHVGPMNFAIWVAIDNQRKSVKSSGLFQYQDSKGLLIINTSQFHDHLIFIMGITLLAEESLHLLEESLYICYFKSALAQGNIYTQFS